MLKKTLCASLASLFLLSAAACAGSGSGNTEQSSKASDSVKIVDTDDDRSKADDGIPAQDFKGASYRVSCSENVAYEVFSEDNKEVVDAAIYDRNLRIEDKYRIEIVPVITYGYAPGEGQLLHERAITASLQADDRAFDVVLMCAWRAGTIIVQNYFMDWNSNIPGVNFEQPWWNSRCNNAFTLNDMLFAAVGDLSLTSLELSHAYLFNKTMADNYRTEDLYQAVYDGRWTVDLVRQISAKIYSDLNKDGNRDSGDEYGFASGVVTNLDAYLPSFGMTMLNKDKNDDVTLSFADDKNVRSRMITAYEKVHDLFYKNEGSYISLTHAEYSDRYTMFAEGRVLFTDGTLNTITEYLGTMNDSYGVLPYPMLDENQGGYYSNAHDNFSVICLAYNVEDLDMVGKVTESLNCENYRTVYSAYYDLALKTRYTESDDDENMLDLITEGRNYDLAVLFAPDLANLYYVFRDSLASPEADKLSYLFDRKEDTWDYAIEKIQSTYDKLAEAE